MSRRNRALILVQNFKAMRLFAVPADGAPRRLEFGIARTLDDDRDDAAAVAVLGKDAARADSAEATPPRRGPAPDACPCVARYLSEAQPTASSSYPDGLSSGPE